MSKSLVVLPFIAARRTRICLDSMATGFRERVMLVDNTVENRGVAASWNEGGRLVLEHDLDWLVVLSAGVRFGWHGGLDFLDHLDTAPNDVPVTEADNGLGWHLIAFRRETLERVGLFDEQFWPAYCEDLDWSVRFQRAYDCDTHAPGWEGPLWPKVPADAWLVEVAHGIKRGGVVVDLEEMRRKHFTKWGEQEQYRTPYNDPTLDWTYVGPPKGCQ